MAIELTTKLKLAMEHLSGIWDTLLTIGMAVFGYAYKSTKDDLKEATSLLNQTRVELARDYVPRSTMHDEINKVISAIHRLDEKMDNKFDALIQTIQAIK